MVVTDDEDPIATLRAWIEEARAAGEREPEAMTLAFQRFTEQALWLAAAGILLVCDVEESDDDAVEDPEAVELIDDRALDELVARPEEVRKEVSPLEYCATLDMINVCNTRSPGAQAGLNYVWVEYGRLLELQSRSAIRELAHSWAL